MMILFRTLFCISGAFSDWYSFWLSETRSFTETSSASAIFFVIIRSGNREPFSHCETAYLVTYTLRNTRMFSAGSTSAFWKGFGSKRSRRGLRSVFAFLFRLSASLFDAAEDTDAVSPASFLGGVSVTSMLDEDTWGSLEALSLALGTFWAALACASFSRSARFSSTDCFSYKRHYSNYSWKPGVRHFHPRNIYYCGWRAPYRDGNLEKHLSYMWRWDHMYDMVV